MAIPTGVTVTAAPLAFAPTSIVSTAPATVTMLSTYLAPLLTGMEITAPTGSKVSGFTFRVNTDGTSVAMVLWTAV